jgi:hypothetical protein
MTLVLCCIAGAAGKAYFIRASCRCQIFKYAGDHNLCKFQTEGEVWPHWLVLVVFSLAMKETFICEKKRKKKETN